MLTDCKKLAQKSNINTLQRRLKMLSLKNKKALTATCLLMLCSCSTTLTQLQITPPSELLVAEPPLKKLTPSVVNKSLPDGVSSVSGADALEYLFYLKYKYLLLKNKYNGLRAWASSSIFD